jgi:Uma2 family endonuclease
MQEHIMRVARLFTAEEFQNVVCDERCELVDGRIVPMTPVGFTHNAMVGRLTWLIGQHVYPRSLGTVGPELGVKLKVDPDTVLAPDVTFIRRERIKDPDDPGFWQGSPDLAIEVKSPSDSMTALRRKAQTYLSYGTMLVLLVDPKSRTVSVHRRDAVPITLRNVDDKLDLDPAVPGFRCTLGEIFGQA